VNSPNQEDAAPILPNSVRDAVVALSLSNLNFLRLWRELVYESPSDDYFLAAATSATYFGAILCCVFLGVAIFVALRFLSAWESRLSWILRAILLGLLLVNPLNFTRSALDLFEFGEIVGFPPGNDQYSQWDSYWPVRLH